MRKRTIHTSKRVMAYVLLISQLLTSCGGFNEIGLDKRQGPIPQSGPVENLSTEEVKTEALSSYGPYPLKNGYQVTFIECDGIWMAQVTELLPPGFKRDPFTLPVYLQRGVGIQEINHQAHIGIKLPSKHNNESGYVVCARQAGLLGGMPPKHAKCKYHGDEYKQNNNGDWVCPSGNHTVKNKASANKSASSSTSHQSYDQKNKEGNQSNIPVDQTYNEPTGVGASASSLFTSPTGPNINFNIPSMPSVPGQSSLLQPLRMPLLPNLPATLNRPINLHLPFGSHLPAPSRFEQVYTSDGGRQIMSGLLDLGMTFVHHAREMDRMNKFYKDRLERDLSDMRETAAASTKRAEEWSKFYKAEAEFKAVQEEEQERKKFAERKKTLNEGRQEYLPKYRSYREDLKSGRTIFIPLLQRFSDSQVRGSVRKVQLDVDDLKESIADNKALGLSSMQQEDLKDALSAIDELSTELKGYLKDLEYCVANPHVVQNNPHLGNYTPENLELVKSLLKELDQQKEALRNLVASQGENLDDYIDHETSKTTSKPEDPAETQAYKELVLGLNDPTDAPKIVTAFIQEMKQMLETYQPNPGRREPQPAAVISQAQKLYSRVKEYIHILDSQKWVIDHAYFGDGICDYLERSTEEGIQKLQILHQTADALQEWGESFGRQFGVYDHTAYPPQTTKAYLQNLVTALVDQMVPGSELAQGNTTPTTAESWADLALSAGLDALQKTDPNIFKDATGVKLPINPAGSTRYNLLKKRIVEVYQKRTGATGTKQSSTSASSSQPASSGSGNHQPSANASSSKPPESNKGQQKPEEKPKTPVEKITEEVNEYLELHKKGAASKAEWGDLLTRTEALKKETKKSYRTIDSLIDDEVPTSAAVLREQLAKHQKDLNQLRDLRKQLKGACKFSKEELDSCKVRLKPKEADDGFQTDSSCEDNMSREDQAFNKGVLKGVGPGIVAALKGSAEGLYHLATSPVATIEGLVEFLENIDEVPGLLAASLEELEGMDPEQQGEAIAKLIADQVFTFAVPTSKVKVLQQVSKTKLGAAAVKVAEKTRKVWTLTKENAVAIKVDKGQRHVRYFKSKSDGTWWSPSTSKHGGEAFKVFKETPQGLEWIADADEYGQYILNKHKGPKGKNILWSQLGTVK